MTLALQLGYTERCFLDVQPCGDGMTCLQRDQTMLLMLADGIGHGTHAHRVVNQLSERFNWIYGRSRSMIGIADCMRELNVLLRAEKQSDQAAVALLEVNTESGLIGALSVGNVRIHSVGESSCFSFPCLNGMVGGTLPRQLPVSLRQAEQPSVLLMHSDGVSSREVVPYLQKIIGSKVRADRNAQTIADALLQHCAKLNDDASCAVVVIQEASS